MLYCERVFHVGIQVIDIALRTAPWRPLHLGALCSKCIYVRTKNIEENFHPQKPLKPLVIKLTIHTQHIVLRPLWSPCSGVIPSNEETDVQPNHDHVQT